MQTIEIKWRLVNLYSDLHCFQPPWLCPPSLLSHFIWDVEINNYLCLNGNKIKTQFLFKQMRSLVSIVVFACFAIICLPCLAAAAAAANGDSDDDTLFKLGKTESENDGELPRILTALNKLQQRLSQVEVALKIGSTTETTTTTTTTTTGTDAATSATTTATVSPSTASVETTTNAIGHRYWW